MTKISRSALLMLSAEQMYDLVNDVRAYPEFLPWCGMATILEEDSQQMVARLQMAKGGLSHTFTTRNQLVRPSEIRMDLVEGPFRKLAGLWQFISLEHKACKVALTLEFEIGRAMSNVAVKSLFTQAANTMVDAFCQRAKALYG